jgi:hypothetical protein
MLQLWEFRVWWGRAGILAAALQERYLAHVVRRHALAVEQLAYSIKGGGAQREWLHLSERMFAAVNDAEARMAAQSALRAHTRC